jgi:Subunit 17 of Mediator complex
VFERRPGTIGLMSVDTGGTEEENLRAQVAELRCVVFTREVVTSLTRFSAELKSAQVELTRERANVAMYQELAQTAELALEEERKTKDETISKSQQELTIKEASHLRDVIWIFLIFCVGSTSFSSGEGQCAAKRITKSFRAKGGP